MRTFQAGICVVLTAVGAFAGENSISADSRYGHLPISFEPNVGQTDRSVDFLSRGPGYTIFLRSGGAVVRKGDSIWKMHLEGAHPSSKATGLEPLSARSHYLTGPSASKWHTEVPQFARVRYHSVYPGVDMVYYESNRQLEYDFVLAPGANPDQIRLAFEGHEDILLDTNGELVVKTSGGEVRQHKPRIYQKLGEATREVAGGYVLHDNRVGFEIGPYDHSKPLVIDPVLGYSTFLGGFRNDAANTIAVDGAGNAYIAGWTESTDFPVLNPRQNISGGGVDAFVAKVNASGALVYATYLGGSGDDRVFGIAVEGSGAAVISGWTYSADFPVYLALQPAFGGGRDAFIAKLNAAGNGFVFSTYLGGNGFEWGRAVAIDQPGNIYATGETDSINFRLLNPFQSSAQGRQDVFITKLSTAGSLVYSTYLGGYGDDSGTGIAVDAGGNAYITGSSDSTNLPTYSAYQSSNRGGQDAFVAKLSPAGNQLVYSTYLGGRNGTVGLPEGGTSIAVDGSGNAYVTGTTSSPDFPTISAFRPGMPGGGNDAFVTKVNPYGSGLVYSTFLGGVGVDSGTGIAIDTTGAAYVTGYTTSVDFPIAEALQLSNSGLYDAFVVVLAPGGLSLNFGTYLGGLGADSAAGIAVDGKKNIYVAGQTLSYNFPLLTPLQTLNGGGYGAFVTKLGNPPCTVGVSPSGPFNIPSSGGAQSFSIIAPSSCAWTVVRDVDWITITSGLSGSGNGVVSFQVAAYSGGAPRTGSLWIGQQTLSVTQKAPISNNEAFVRQLYLDLYSRQADPTGLSTWTNTLNAGQTTRAQAANSFFTNAEFSNFASYVAKLYLGVLQRGPDYGGWSSWVAALRGGQSQTSALAGFLASAEYQSRFGYLASQSNSDFVTFLYRNLLGREPDSGGLSYWNNALNTNAVARADVIFAFFQSPEYDSRMKNPMSAHLLYLSFLLRTGDAGGVNYWTDFLKTHATIDAVNIFTTSPEYLARF